MMRRWVVSAGHRAPVAAVARRQECRRSLMSPRCRSFSSSFSFSFSGSLAHISRAMPFRFRLWISLCFCVSGALLRAEEPFVFEKNPGRLPKTIIPQRYEWRIETDIGNAAFADDETTSLEDRH